MDTLKMVRQVSTGRNWCCVFRKAKMIKDASRLLLAPSPEASLCLLSKVVYSSVMATLTQKSTLDLRATYSMMPKRQNLFPEASTHFSTR